MLPVRLPETDQLLAAHVRPRRRDEQPGEPARPRSTDWVDVELDLGDGPQRYRRDTNVMPQWAGSCWYELRYLDPTNENAFVDPAVERYWMGPAERRATPGGVDLYVGGVEHAVLHLLYARFWHKVLFDLGHVSSMRAVPPPVQPGLHPGRRLHRTSAACTSRPPRWSSATAATCYDGEPVTREYGKMGKSLKNAVAPDEMCDEYGADTLRLYEMSMGPLDASRPWETRDVVGMHRFLQRLWRNLVDEDDRRGARAPTPADDETRRAAAPHHRRRARPTWTTCASTRPSPS